MLHVRFLECVGQVSNRIVVQNSSRDTIIGNHGRRFLDLFHLFLDNLQGMLYTSLVVGDENIVENCKLRRWRWRWRSCMTTIVSVILEKVKPNRYHLMVLLLLLLLLCLDFIYSIYPKQAKTQSDDTNDGNVPSELYVLLERFGAV